MYKSIAFFALIFALFLSSSFAHPGEHEEPVSVSLLAANEDFKARCKRSGCTLASELVEGPYYVALDYLRSNITEGTSGIPMFLVITVVDFSTCQPIENAAIDIWHANATGVYSHYNTQGNYGGATSTFLRGVQLTDSSGVARMTTILPGWYTGRAVHTHIKVHIGGTAENSTYYSPGNIVHTGQLFPNQSIVDSYTTVSPYSTNTQTLTSLADDTIYPGTAALFDLEYVDSTAGLTGGVYAYATVVVNTTYVSTSVSASGGASSPPSSSGGASSPPSSSSTSTTASSTTTTTTTTSSSDSTSTTSEAVSTSTTSEAVSTTTSFAVLSAVPFTSLIAGLFCFVVFL